MVVNFLSHPVINGFTNAAAIIIASSQFSKFFGVYVDKAPHHYETMLRVAQAAMDYTHIPTLLYGIGAVAIMVILKKINPRIPAVLVAVAITTMLSYFTGFNHDAVVDISAIRAPGIEAKIQRTFTDRGSFIEGNLRDDPGNARGEVDPIESFQVGADGEGLLHRIKPAGRSLYRGNALGTFLIRRGTTHFKITGAS
jgi:hypothetical protein